MAEIIPFKSVRPTHDKVHLVATRSYISYKPKHLDWKLNQNPYSFVHIINPEYGQEKKSLPNSDERFENVKAKYREFVSEGHLVQDETPSIYIYRQITPTETFLGFICGVQVQEYLDGKIKIHEQTLTSRVEVFTKYLDVCDFNAEPVLLTYKSQGIEFPKIIESHTSERPEYDFTNTDKIRHQLWLVSDQKEIKVIQDKFAGIESLYIADGHHRMASSANLGKNRKERDSSWSPEDICNFALALVIPDSTLSIQAFHRVINLDRPLDEAALLQKLEKDFDIKKCKDYHVPELRHEFGMRLYSGWYELKLKTPITSQSAVDNIDPMVLTNKILEPIFDIHDQKTDNRISFVPANEPIEKLEHQIDHGDLSVIFTLHPISTQELFDVSDANEIMPPKSTYIEPKLRSGLTIMNLSETKLG